MRPESLHVTLVFLGYQYERDVERIAERPSRRAFEPCELQAEEVRGVPRGRPRLLALQLADPAGALARWQAALSERLHEARLYEPEKRPFWPHVTLARAKRGKPPRGLAPPALPAELRRAVQCRTGDALQLDAAPAGRGLRAARRRRRAVRSNSHQGGRGERVVGIKRTATALCVWAIVAVGMCAPAIADHRVRELVSTGPLGGNQNFTAGFSGASNDGRHIFFSTAERLTADDGDGSVDVYERVDGRDTTLVSTGPAGGNGAFFSSLYGVSADGTRAFVYTEERLVEEDTDNQFDIYERTEGVIRLVSKGPIGGNGDFATQTPRGAGQISEDGGHVFFETYERLTADDTDTGIDIYEHVDGTTTRLVSTGPSAGTGSNASAEFDGASDDGRHVFFTTTDSLVPEDTCCPSRFDIYERVDGAETRLVSVGPLGGNADLDAFIGGITPDGRQVFFNTSERLTADDGDTRGDDVYVRRNGETTTLITAGYDDENSTANFAGASVDGSHVFFHTLDSLVPEDLDVGCGTFNDRCEDVYERHGGVTSLVSTGPLGGSGPFFAAFLHSSEDGTRVLFRTSERLTQDDGGSADPDIYERRGGTTQLISTGPGPGGGGSFFPNDFSRASADGERVFFFTREPLLAADQNGTFDTYERAHGATSIPGSRPDGTVTDSGSGVAGISPDGRLAYVTTAASLLPADTDGTPDVYLAAVNREPACDGVRPNRRTLSPANHKLVLVTLTGATDQDGDAVALEITSVSQDEPVNGEGDSDTAPDARPGSATDAVMLRAERSGRGDGRVYRIAFRATDSFGGECRGTATVAVSRGTLSPVDSAPPSFDSSHR